MEDVPQQQLQLSPYRKHSFKSEKERKNHASMLKGLFTFLETLRKDGICAVMENDKASTLFARRPLPTLQIDGRKRQSVRRVNDV